jgi:hypothetical protein
VLRELAFLHDAIASARETGVAIDALPLPRSVRSASRRKAGAARRKD